jgi:hypothetical protein
VATRGHYDLTSPGCELSSRKWCWTPSSVWNDLTSPEGVIPLKLLVVERLRGDVVWLHYQVVRF